MAEEEKQELTEEEKEARIAEIMRELDEELEAHERYREEYGRKRAGLTREELYELELRELRESYEWAKANGMQIVTVDMPDEEE